MGQTFERIYPMECCKICTHHLCGICLQYEREGKELEIYQSIERAHHRNDAEYAWLALDHICYLYNSLAKEQQDKPELIKAIKVFDEWVKSLDI